MVERNERLSPLAKERWLLEESSAGERARVTELLGEREREALRDEDRALRAHLAKQLPPEPFARRVKAAAALALPRKTMRAPLAFAALGACVCLTLLFAVRPRDDVALSEVADSRAKGLLPELHMYRKRGDDAERLSMSSTLRAHDVVQLGYVAAGFQHGVLLSIDGAGNVTLHFPSEPSASTKLEPGQGEHMLESAYELDDAPAFERFFFVASPQPLSVPALLTAARSMAGDPQRAQREMLEVAGQARQSSMLLRKEHP